MLTTTWVSPAARRVNSSLTPGRRSFVSALPAGSRARQRRRPAAHSGKRCTSRREAKILSTAIPDTMWLALKGRCSSGTDENPRRVEQSEDEVESGRPLDHGVETPRRRVAGHVAPEAQCGEHAREDEGALRGDDAEGHQPGDRDVSFEQECPIYEDRNLPAEDYGQRPSPASTVGDEIPDVVGQQDRGHGSTNRQRRQRHIRRETTSLHGIGDDDDQNSHKDEHRGLAGGSVGYRARSGRIEVAAESRETPEYEYGPAAHCYQVDAEKQCQCIAKQRTRKDAARTHPATYYGASDPDCPGCVEAALRVVELVEHVGGSLYEQASEEHCQERSQGERAVLERQCGPEEHRHSRRSEAERPGKAEPLFENLPSRRVHRSANCGESRSRLQSVCSRFSAYRLQRSGRFACGASTGSPNALPYGASGIPGGAVALPHCCLHRPEPEACYLIANLKPDAYCGTTGSRGSRPFQWTRELLSAAGPTKAVDQERVRAGRGDLCGEGFLGDRRGPRAARLRDLLRPLRGRVRGQRRVRRRGGPQAPTQEVQTRRQR